MSPCVVLDESDNQPRLVYRRFERALQIDFLYWFYAILITTLAVTVADQLTKLTRTLDN